ncbi:MAG: RluA family pseudouridine synthase [bacterium]|nr:RluA family pseudouridine synthase [bacterium]
MQIFKVRVKPVEDRLDRFLASQTKNLSRSKIQKLIVEGKILVNKKGVGQNYKIHSGDTITLNLPPPKDTEIKAEDMPVKVLYEDSDLLVIEKESGVVVHPTSDHTSGTIVNWLLFHTKNLAVAEEGIRPGVVHRLDKGTSGLLILGKNSQTTQELKKQFAARQVTKKYTALVIGEMAKPFGSIKTNIGRHPRSFQKFAVLEAGKEAETDYRVVKQFQGFTLVSVFPKTGRTHQIRVHLSSIGFPIVGDKLYGAPADLGRLFLHASEIEFSHPRTGKILKFFSELPDALQAYLDGLSLKKD